MRNIQIIIQRQTLIIIRVDTDFAEERRRSKKLHFDLCAADGVVG